MERSRSNLLFLAVGVALGAAIGYVAASDKKDEWFKEANNLVGKIKTNIKDAMHKSKHHIDEAIDDAER